MKQISKISLSFQSLDANKSVAEKSVSAFLHSYLSETDAADMCCAVSEAINNCFDHAYKDKAGVIFLTMRAYDTNHIKITVKDKGCGIADIKSVSAPLYTTASCEQHSGLGITVMESFADNVVIKSTVGKGTIVTLIKKQH